MSVRVTDVQPTAIGEGAAVVFAGAQVHAAGLAETRLFRVGDLVVQETDVVLCRQSEGGKRDDVPGFDEVVREFDRPDGGHDCTVSA